MVNLNDTINQTTADRTTVLIQAWSSASWVPVGVIGLITNALAVLTIIKSKLLHTKYFCTLASLMVAGCICGASVSYYGAKKAYLTFAGIPETSSQIECLAGLVPVLWATGLSDYLTLALNVDRLLALAAPILYKQKLSKGYVSILNIFSWSIPTVMWIFAFYLPDPQKQVSFCLASIMEKWFQTLYTTMRWVIAAPNLSIFASTLISLKIKFNKTKHLGLVERRAARKALEVHMVKTMGVIVACYVLMKLGGYATLSIAVVALEGSAQAKLIGVTGVLPPAYAGSHFWVYLIMSKDFRQCFKKMIMMKNSTTSPLFIASTSKQ